MNTGTEICFYIAENGSDQWSGTLSTANPAGTDGPFATLGRAIAAARGRSGGNRKKIILRGGSYFDVAVELRPEDSGLTIEAMLGEKPVLYGGRKITGWKKEENSAFWYAEIPEAGSGEWDFRMLSVAGRFASRARLPETGRFEHRTEFAVDWLSTSEGGWARKPTREELTTMVYDPKDLGPWLDIRNAELTIFHKWDESMAGIAAQDAAANTLRLSNPCGHPPGAFNYNSYIVWNVREGMKKPGQWYLDRTSGRVVYWPLPDENMEEIETVAPTCCTILEFTGQVRDITVKGLKLAAANTPLLAANFAAIRMPGALQSLDGMENCVLSDLVIENTAGHGIKIEGRNKCVDIVGCEIGNTGAGGILFYNNLQEMPDNNIEVVAKCLSEDVNSDTVNCSISNNLLHNTGLISPSAIAIASHYCNISHNEVTDTAYTGICSGGGSARIEYNVVSRAMQVLNDGAAIYVTFCRDGLIRGNVIRDIPQGNESDSTKNAIYLDEQTVGWVVEGNLVVNCTQPEFNHMAQGNTIRDNVFISDSYLKMNFIRCKDYKVEGNILYAEGKIIFAQNEDAVAGCGGNTIYSASGEYQTYLINEKYQHYETVPLHAVEGTHFEDPLFVDLERRNYELREDSPVFRQGVRRMEYRKAGRN